MKTCRKAYGFARSQHQHQHWTDRHIRRRWQASDWSWLAEEGTWLKCAVPSKFRPRSSVPATSVGGWREGRETACSKPLKRTGSRRHEILITQNRPNLSRLPMRRSLQPVSGQLQAMAALSPGIKPLYPLDRRLLRPHIRCGHSNEDKNCCPCRKFNPHRPNHCLAIQTTDQVYRFTGIMNG
jgi:hypothetical protein